VCLRGGKTIEAQPEGEAVKTRGKNIGDVYGPAMKIIDQKHADECFEGLVVENLSARPNITREQAEQTQRSNLGYYAGYYDNETRERVERLFKCAHPIFGDIATNGAPTAEQAFKMGVKEGRKHKP
jgi:hypothetical protein